MIRIPVLTLAIFLFAISFVHAQEKSDSLRITRVMLVPFDPRYYLSDADRDIVEQTNVDVKTIRHNFRTNIDRHVQRHISRSYPCISLLNDTANALEETMYYVLGRTGYKYEKAIPLTIKEKGNTVTKRKDSNTEEYEDSKTASRYIPVEEDAMYMHAVVTKPRELFRELDEKYDVDVFVFLTQLEIRTNYKTCLDIANKIYRREVMLHFSVFDKSGRLLAGSYATSYFPSDSNNANSIMGECFSQIAEYVAGALP